MQNTSHIDDLIYEQPHVTVVTNALSELELQSYSRVTELQHHVLSLWGFLSSGVRYEYYGGTNEQTHHIIRGLELIYLYFPPSFHLIVVVSVL